MMKLVFSFEGIMSNNVKYDDSKMGDDLFGC